MSNDTDAKEWVTIKVPKAVRDDAQADPRTYGEIMRAGMGDGGSDHSTATVTARKSQLAEAIADEVAERLEGSKPLEDMAFEDWFEPDYAQTIARHVTAELTAGELSDRLERIESAAQTTEERTNSIQNTLEGLGR